MFSGQKMMSGSKRKAAEMSADESGAEESVEEKTEIYYDESGADESEAEKSVTAESEAEESVSEEELETEKSRQRRAMDKCVYEGAASSVTKPERELAPYEIWMKQRKTGKLPVQVA
jgi:hypothetical protein